MAKLEEAYRKCKDAKEKTLHQAIWLYAQHPSPGAVGRVVWYSPKWVHKRAVRYNQAGLVGLDDVRTEQPGGDQRAILCLEEQARLMKALQGKAPDGARWTAPKLAAWVQAQTLIRPSELRNVHGRQVGRGLTLE